MADLGDSSWNEVDASNNASPPNGWPEGMQPSDVNNAARAQMGGEKRWWDRSNTVLTTGGTSTAYTLTYAQAAAAYYNGEEFACIINATCGATPSLNINGLGAANLRKFVAGAWATLAAGDLAANQSVRVYYNSAVPSFDIVAIPVAVGGWQPIGTATPTAVSSVSFQTIPTSINSLQVILDLTFATAGALYMQFYNSAGTLDTSAVYGAWGSITDSSPSTVPYTALLQGAVQMTGLIQANAVVGVSGSILIPNIQAVKDTQCGFQLSWPDSLGALTKAVVGAGYRGANGNITGIKLLNSGGNFSGGRITLLGMTN